MWNEGVVIVQWTFSIEIQLKRSLISNDLIIDTIIKIGISFVVRNFRFILAVNWSNYFWDFFPLINYKKYILYIWNVNQVKTFAEVDLWIEANEEQGLSTLDAAHHKCY